jgi:hypothetical protein
MDTTLSAAIKEAYASRPEVIVYHTLEIYHPAFEGNAPIRVVRDNTDLLAVLEATAPRNPSTQVTFVGMMFDIIPPDVSDAGAPVCKIEMDNVSREILKNIDLSMESQDAITVIYRAYEENILTVPANNPPLEFTLLTVTATPLRISATAGMLNFNNKKFPGMSYDSTVFPELIAA